MKSVRILSGLLVTYGLFGASPALAAETVEFNKTHVMRLSAPAGAIVVGNPKIADVSVHSDNTIFVFGRGFGQTDLLILDGAGNTLVHTDINVVEKNAGNSVRMMFPGRGNKTFDCNPYCRPAPVLSDDAEFRALYTGQAAGAAGGTTAAVSGAGTSSQPGQLSGGDGPESARSGLSDTQPRSEERRQREF